VCKHARGQKPNAPNNLKPNNNNPDKSNTKNYRPQKQKPTTILKHPTQNTNAIRNKKPEPNSKNARRSQNTIDQPKTKVKLSQNPIEPN